MLCLPVLVRCLAWALAVLALGAPAQAAEVRAAVAANFADPARAIAREFEAATGHRAILSFGSTGQLYAQIVQGAPFDVLLSADQATVRKVLSEGHGVAGSAFTYAVGKLVLYSRSLDVGQGEATLRQGAFAKIAIANPELAPYGAAAIQTMRAVGVAESLAPKIVTGQSIAQAFQFVETGNAELGFVALSQVVKLDHGSRWVVPETMHTPILQDAVLLVRAESNHAALAFVDFLKAKAARTAIEDYGYGVPD